LGHERLEKGDEMQGIAKKSVLIVDNNERVLWSLQGLLEGAGFDTCITWSGHDALALLKTHGYDVLLVDDYLPDVHSGDFLARVGRLPVQPWIVVMQGTAPSSADWKRYAALGAAGIVNKGDPQKVCNMVFSCCADEPLATARVN
jgi:CheY-like chemotaxis protein